MNPIESSHHLKEEEYCEYREGVVINRPSKEGAGSWVDIGLKKVGVVSTATKTRQEYSSWDSSHSENKRAIPRPEDGLREV